MLVAHNRPDGSRCHVAGHAGKKCLHCGVTIPLSDQSPLPVRAKDPDVEPDGEIVEEADEISAEEKALAAKNKERVLGLVRKHLTIEDLAEHMVERGCQEGSITIGQTRRLVILPD